MDSAERSAETAPLPVATAAARVNEARAGSCLAPRVDAARACMVARARPSIGSVLVLLGFMIVNACTAARREPAPGLAAAARAAEQGAQAAALAGDRERAVGLEEQALGSWRRIDASRETASALLRIAGLGGKGEDAGVALAEAMEIARAGGFGDIEAAALVEQASLAPPDQSRGLLERATVLAAAADADEVEAAALNDLALLDRAGGDERRARQRLERALALDRDGERTSAVALRLRNLARLDLDAGDPATARTRAESALALARGVEDVPAIAASLVLLSEAAAAAGDPAAAIQARKRAADIHRALGDAAAQRADEQALTLWCALPFEARPATAFACGPREYSRAER